MTGADADGAPYEVLALAIDDEFLQPPDDIPTEPAPEPACRSVCRRRGRTPAARPTRSSRPSAKTKTDPGTTGDEPVSDPQPLASGEPEIGVAYYADVFTRCKGDPIVEVFVGDSFWVSDVDTSSWAEPTEGGTFTRVSYYAAEFVGDAQGTKTAKFRLPGPAEDYLDPRESCRTTRWPGEGPRPAGRLGSPCSTH